VHDVGREAALWLQVVIAVLGWCALLLQLVLIVRVRVASGGTAASAVIDYLGYFTVLTNILVTFLATSPLVASPSAAAAWSRRPAVIGGAAASIALVSITYHLILREQWAPQGLQWLADVLLHYVVPLLFALYWFMAASAAPLTWTAPLMWALYPLVFLVYALVRGALIGRYPYPFIDVTAIGYARAMINAVGLLAGFLIFSGVMTAFARWRARDSA
jgi:hypothetical protein